MLARSYHDLHECNSSQLVVIIIAFIIRHHLEHIILCLRSIFNRCVPSPTLTVEESQHWRNLSYACHIQVVTTWLTPSKQSSHKWVSSNLRTWKLTTTVAKFGYTLAPLQDDHICICLHSCLCRTSIFAFLPLQDEQGVNSSCSHWQFDKTHFSSTIKWSFIS